MILSIGARKTPLSQAQVREVLAELRCFYPKVEFAVAWVETTGDKDLNTSLKTLEKTDFFTREIDALQLAGGCRLAIHSAKDLPEPLPQGLKVVAITQGVDPSDSLVFREGENLNSLPFQSLIGASSERREEVVRSLRSDLICIDIRGAIGQRLALLDEKKVDGVVIAEAALIRLGLTDKNRLRLNCPTVPLQGKLAIVARAEDVEMQQFFSVINTYSL
jgi:hydroxymethylbilane synthase